MGLVEDRQLTSGPSFLGDLRDRLLDQVLGLLKADTDVGGVALIGSLGRGEADNWSDIDLLILMGDEALARFTTADEIRRIYLSYVPIAGKYIGRRSPQAGEMIRFLGKMPAFSSGDPAAQLLALRGIAGDLSDPSWAWLGDAVTSYLGLVEASSGIVGRGA
jgi:predicted nucleotidyltransferase